MNRYCKSRKLQQKNFLVKQRKLKNRYKTLIMIQKLNSYKPRPKQNRSKQKSKR